MLNRSILHGGGMILLAVMGIALAGCSSNPCGDPCAPVCDPCDPCASQGPAGIPTDVQPGEAWCRVYIPPKYEEVCEQVCVCPESCERKWVEPVYENRTKQVMVCPEQVKQIPVPAVYETVEEQVMVCPEQVKRIPVPAVYETVEEEVMVLSLIHI